MKYYVCLKGLSYVHCKQKNNHLTISMAASRYFAYAAAPDLPATARKSKHHHFDIFCRDYFSYSQLPLSIPPFTLHEVGINQQKLRGANLPQSFHHHFINFHDQWRCYSPSFRYLLNCKTNSPFASSTSGMDADVIDMVLCSQTQFARAWLMMC